MVKYVVKIKMEKLEPYRGTWTWQEDLLEHLEENNKDTILCTEDMGQGLLEEELDGYEIYDYLIKKAYPEGRIL